MKYLRYFEEKHYLKDYFIDKSLLDNLDDWGLDTYKLGNSYYKHNNNSSFITLQYKHDDNIYVKMSEETTQKRTVLKVYANVTDAGVRFNATNLKKFDLKELLDEVLRFDKCVDLYGKFREIHTKYDFKIISSANTGPLSNLSDEEIEKFHKKFFYLTCNKRNIINVEKLKEFNDLIEELDDEFGYLLTGGDMGLL